MQKMPSKTSKNTPKSNKGLPPKHYEELGRIVASVYETGYLDAAKSYKQSFLKGLFQGFGGVLGATILVAVLIWILSLFSELPFIGRVTEQVQDTIQSQE